MTRKRNYVGEEQLDRTKLRYVLYARKSTEDETSQPNSIEDQLLVCRKLAEDKELNIVHTITENKSAKRPNNRPGFQEMLIGIASDKYDAILCRHPDRLCRNMLEGGQIINFLDEDVLKDIFFQSHQFSNNASGKMLLGMMFVFSKNYSDDLSAKVTQGVRGNFSEGVSSGSPKWGYTRNPLTGLYEPNEFFDTIQESWQMRENGESLQKCLEYILSAGVFRTTKAKKIEDTIIPARKIKPKLSGLSKLYRDSFYFGVLVQAKQTVDLRDIMNDFKPMVSEESFSELPRTKVRGFLASACWGGLFDSRCTA